MGLKTNLKLLKILEETGLQCLSMYSRLKTMCLETIAVSYTHRDVYKRQVSVKARVKI